MSWQLVYIHLWLYTMGTGMAYTFQCLNKKWHTANNNVWCVAICFNLMIFTAQKTCLWQKLEILSLNYIIVLIIEFINWIFTFFFIFTFPASGGASRGMGVAVAIALYVFCTGNKTQYQYLAVPCGSIKKHRTDEVITDNINCLL